MEETFSNSQSHEPDCESDVEAWAAQFTKNTPESSSITAPDIEAICKGSGWPCVSRSAEHWMVELDGTPTYCQAEVEVKDSSLRLSVLLDESDLAGPASIAAIAHLLARAQNSFPGVSASLTKTETRQRARLSACLLFSQAEALPRVLGQLSEAASSLLREVEALHNPEIAQEYATRCMHSSCESEP